jgi:hypothetical protein
MSNTLIQIKRSTTNTAPNFLNEGELAYSYLSNVLYIGNTTNVAINIGGYNYVSIIENRTSSNSANTLVARDANGRIQLNQIELLSSPQSNNFVSTKLYTDYTASVAANGAITVARSYNSNINDTVSSITVGGATPQTAAYWKTKQIAEVLDAMLFPDLNPTYTIPTISFSGSTNGIREIGQTISQIVTINGTKNDAGNFNSISIIRISTYINTNNSLTPIPTSDVPSQFGYNNPNNPNYNYSHTYTDSYVVAAGVTNWYGIANYAQGIKKLNNKGVIDARNYLIRNPDAPQDACTFFQTAGSASVTGIYPYFWGVSATQPTGASVITDIQNGNTNKVLSDSSGTISAVFNASSQYVWIAHPAVNTTKTKWYNTALNNGNIGAGQFILAPITQNVNSPDLYWNNVPYKIYISGFATTTSGSIEFRNS